MRSFAPPAAAPTTSSTGRSGFQPVCGACASARAGMKSSAERIRNGYSSSDYFGQPGLACAIGRLEAFDLRQLFERDADIVQALHQAVLSRCVDIEVVDASVG